MVTTNNNKRTTLADHAKFRASRIIQSLRGAGRDIYADYRNNVPGLTSVMLKVEIDDLLISKGSRGNSYGTYTGTAAVARNKQGKWYPALTGSTLVFVGPRELDRNGNFFHDLAVARHNQALQSSFSKPRFKGTIEVSAHSVSQMQVTLEDGPNADVLVIEANAVYGKGRASWSVMNHPFADSMRAAIESRRKPQEEAETEPVEASS